MITNKQIKKIKKNIILYIGLLSDNKGTKDLLTGFDIFCDKYSDYELHLAGKDNIKLSQFIKNFKHKDKIKYLGFIDEIYPIMAEAKVLVVTSIFEGFGFITAEAMLNGTLVIGRNTAGTKEQFDNCKRITGKECALRYDNPNQLPQRLIEAVEMNEKEYMEKTSLAYKVVCNLYTNEINGENILNFYKKILNYE